MEFVSLDKLKEPRVGDLIEINRGLYRHWCVYVGNWEVIQVTGSGQEITANSAFIRCTKLDVVTGPCKLRVNNKEKEAIAKELTPYSPEVVIRNAKAFLDKEVEYNLIYKNCEHYVTKWKYGYSWSDQVATIHKSFAHIVRSSLTEDSLKKLKYNFLYMKQGKNFGNTSRHSTL